jgi:hypothetical protein
MLQRLLIGDTRYFEPPVHLVMSNQETAEMRLAASSNGSLDNAPEFAPRGLRQCRLGSR